SVQSPAMLTLPSVAAVKAETFVGSTGTSPTPAALVTWIVPAGAVRMAPLLIVTGPPTRARVCPELTPSVLPLTVSAGGVAVSKPNAAGGAAVKVLPLGLVA